MNKKLITVLFLIISTFPHQGTTQHLSVSEWRLGTSKAASGSNILRQYRNRQKAFKPLPPPQPMLVDQHRRLAPQETDRSSWPDMKGWMPSSLLPENI